MDTVIRYYEVHIIKGPVYQFTHYADAKASIRMTYHMVEGVQFRESEKGYEATVDGGTVFAIALKEPKKMVIYGQPEHF